MNTIKLFIFLFLLTYFKISSGTTLSEKRFYVIPSYNLSFLTLTPHEILATHGDLVLAYIDVARILEKAPFIHKITHVCGGFYDVNEEYKFQDAIRFLNQITFNSNKIFLKSKALEIRYPEIVKNNLNLIKMERYQSIIRRLSSFTDRYSRSQTGLQASQWIESELNNIILQSHRQDITIERFQNSKEIPQYSIVVKVQGLRSDLPGVLLGGHMDTLSRNKPGADDDGTGSASTFEVFKTLLDTHLKFERDLYFAFYAAEEIGLVGSAVVAKYFADNKIALDGIMQLDMTGYNTEKLRKELYLITDFTDSELTQFVKILAKEYLGISSDNIGLTACGYACSDHASWNRYSYPTVFPFESASDNYNPAIHTSEDKMEALDLVYSEKFMKLALAFLIEMADPVLQ